MKKLFSTALFAVMILGWGTTFAQCNIITPNTTSGFTPDPPATITQGVAYAQTVQVYVPTTYPYVISGQTITVTLDSVHIASMSALPTGISYVFNPVDGGGGTVIGGGNGAICFAGTTTDTVGTYTVVFNGTVYYTGPLGAGTLPLSQVATAFHYAFTVQAAPAVSICDTTLNQRSSQDEPGLFPVGVTNDSGFIAGNNFYGDLIKAEGFASVEGDVVTSADLFFGYTAINSADSNQTVWIKIWNNTGTSDQGAAGAPGTVLDSVSVTLKQIAHAVTLQNTLHSLVPVTVNFTGNVTLATDTFYVGVVLPTTTGDTLALLTNFGPDGNGWEYNAASGGNPAVWGSYNDDWGFEFDGGSVGNYIAVVMCGNAPLANFSASTLTGCTPLAINFTDASINSPTTYSWTFGDGGTSTSASPAHTFTTAGVYTVVEVVSSTGGSSNNATTVTVNASPTGTVAVTPATGATGATNGSATVTASGLASPFTYLWTPGQTTAATLSGVAAGTYIVLVTDSNGCTVSDTAVITFVSGILQLNGGVTVKIYPNPATDVLNLIWSQASNAEVSVVDLNGNVISTLITNGDMKTAFDIHSLAAGSYIVRITDKNSNQQQSMLFSKF